VAFARSRATDEHNIALMLKECAAGEIAYQGLVDGDIVKDEVVDIFGKQQFGDGDLVFDRSRLLLPDLYGE
jgi:hypothetical protein